jgi:hypothetical protein
MRMPEFLREMKERFDREILRDLQFLTCEDSSRMFQDICDEVDGRISRNRFPLLSELGFETAKPSMTRFRLLAEIGDEEIRRSGFLQAFLFLPDDRFPLLTYLGVIIPEPAEDRQPTWRCRSFCKEKPIGLILQHEIFETRSPVYWNWWNRVFHPLAVDLSRKEALAVESLFAVDIPGFVLGIGHSDLLILDSDSLCQGAFGEMLEAAVEAFGETVWLRGGTETEARVSTVYGIQGPWIISFGRTRLGEEGLCLPDHLEGRRVLLVGFYPGLDSPEPMLWSVCCEKAASGAYKIRGNVAALACWEGGRDFDQLWKKLRS